MKPETSPKAEGRRPKEIPDSNIQHPEKHQYCKNQHPSSQIPWMFEHKKPARMLVTTRAGAWNLEFVWNLVVGIWNFRLPNNFPFSPMFPTPHLAKRCFGPYVGPNAVAEL
jgi:hypothetical protein